MSALLGDLSRLNHDSEIHQALQAFLGLQSAGSLPWPLLVMRCIYGLWSTGLANVNYSSSFRYMLLAHL